MEPSKPIAASAPAMPGHVTRIARRRARPGQEAAYEALVREMFGQMRASKGFLAADLLPPEAPGGDYQVVVNFASEADLAAWDACPARSAIHARMREVAEAEPEYRSLSGLEAWFAPAVVPASIGRGSSISRYSSTSNITTATGVRRRRPAAMRASTLV